MGRPNLTVLTRAQAERIVVEDGRAAALDFRHGDDRRSNGRRIDGRDGAPKRAIVGGELLLAAGAIGSPQLLMVSGLGPGDVLADHGIPVVRDLPDVGGNLQDHLQVRLVFKVAGVPTLNTQVHGWLGKARMGLDYALFRRGPLSMAPSQLGAFARSDPSRATPNLEYHIQPLSTDKLGDPLHRFPAFTASVCNLRPESRGRVDLRSADPFDRPAIRPNYLSADADRRVAADAIRLTRRIAAQPALQKFRPEEFKPGPEIDGDDALARAAGDIATTIFHPVGTCRMGPADDAAAVVDPDLRVRGVAGLRVIDASIMPTITSGNTNSPTIMIAEKAAAAIRGGRG
jgi:choline dehydrogenase